MVRAGGNLPGLNVIDFQTQDDHVLLVASKSVPEILEISHVQKVEALEDQIRAMPPVDLPVTHHFSAGVYARELFIPKGTVLTGHIHKYTNLNIMSQGELSILMEDGSVKRVKAPFTVVSPPGTKRLAYAHEDTIWTTIHGTEQTDVDDIEEHFIAHSHQEYLAFRALLENKEN
jgi:quercetin dioxygenase-like cupin family protein